jgi:ABC-type multidrug transport system fused ATPase/permease subunit
MRYLFFISLFPGDRFPMGLHTQVGAKGAQLSGGQKQRVAVARVILKNPPIVVFDEATSALDAESEHHVQKAISTIMDGRTVISIAHRLSTIRTADRIIVIKNGIVDEMGTFNELAVKENGSFRELMGRQLTKA